MGIGEEIHFGSPLYRMTARYGILEYTDTHPRLILPRPLGLLALIAQRRLVPPLRPGAICPSSRRFTYYRFKRVPYRLNLEPF